MIKIKLSKYLFIICFCSLFLANMKLGLAFGPFPDSKYEPCQLEVKQSSSSLADHRISVQRCQIVRDQEDKIIRIEITSANLYSDLDIKTIEALYQPQIREKIESYITDGVYYPHIIFIPIEGKVFSRDGNEELISNAEILYEVAPSTVRGIVTELKESGRIEEVYTFVRP